MLWGWIKSAVQRKPRYEDPSFRSFFDIINGGFCWQGNSARLKNDGSNNDRGAKPG